MTSLNITELLTTIGMPAWAFIGLMLWSIAWKGLALWKAATLQQKWWFIVLLFVNTVGILEIIYYFFVSRKYKVEVVEN